MVADVRRRMKTMKNTLPDFAGKCVSISLEDVDDSSYDLYDPHFEMQGGRLFIVGTVPHDATRSNWSEGCLSAVAWDRVTDYVVLDSLIAWKNALKKSRSIEKTTKKS